jgi:hypothetical protein
MERQGRSTAPADAFGDADPQQADRNSGRITGQDKV